MASLAELQRRFLAALGDLGGVGAPGDFGDNAPNAELLAHIAPDADAPRRLAIYRNNRRCNLRHALRASYPVVERLVGTEFFNGIADGYIDTEPSRSGNLDEYGAGFAQFIREHSATKNLPYLGDVAALEWLIDDIRSAPDVPDDELVVRPFASIWPVHRIWQCNQPGADADTSVSLDEGAVCLAVVREARPEGATMHFDIGLIPLPRERYEQLLQQFLQQQH